MATWTSPPATPGPTVCTPIPGTALALWVARQRRPTGGPAGPAHAARQRRPLFRAEHLAALGATIAISYTLSQPDSKPVAYVRAYYSPDGGGRWLPAVAASGTITTNLATSPSGVSHVYNWDVFASGFFGRSDNVVFRIVAVPDLRAGANSVPGPYLYGSNASDTYPFRVRGTQVRVMEGGVPVPGALVYRQPAGQTEAGRAHGRPRRSAVQDG